MMENFIFSNFHASLKQFNNYASVGFGSKISQKMIIETFVLSSQYELWNVGFFHSNSFWQSVHLYVAE